MGAFEKRILALRSNGGNNARWGYCANLPTQVSQLTHAVFSKSLRLAGLNSSGIAGKCCRVASLAMAKTLTL